MICSASNLSLKYFVGDDWSFIGGYAYETVTHRDRRASSLCTGCRT